MSVESGLQFIGNRRTRVDWVLYGSREHLFRVFPYDFSAWEFYVSLRRLLGKKYTDIQISFVNKDDKISSLLKVEHGGGSNFRPLEHKHY